MIFIDAHVHIYDCFDLEVFFDSALENFQAAAEFSGIKNQPLFYMLLLAEGKSYNWFQQMVTRVQTGQNIDTSVRRWSILLTDEEALFLTVQRNDSSGGEFFLVAGRQVVTAEKIEVLALFCNTSISDGLSLNETIDTIRESSSIPVIPWGAGKWFGKRGKILQDFLAGYEGKGLFLGDNGGRPLFWSTPSMFHLAREKGLSILPGTDPLPLSPEASRVGSFGFFMDHQPLDLTSPAQSIRDLLITGRETLYPFGQLQNSKSFFMNQLQLRFLARISHL